MHDMTSFLARAADKSGFRRERFVERDIPTDRDRIQVVHVFPDVSSEAACSSLVYPAVRDRYSIVCSWQGHGDLYPSADEYWSPLNQDNLVGGSAGLESRTDQFVVQQRNLNLFFPSPLTHEDLHNYYKYGATQLGRREITRARFPVAVSASHLDPAFIRGLDRPGRKVLVMPTTTARTWKIGRPECRVTSRDFWIHLCSRLLREGYYPVVIENSSTHAISGMLDEGLRVREEDAGRILGMMRTTGLVLDVFSGHSRWAVLAGTPYVAVDERGRYISENEREFQVACGRDVPGQRVFSFSSLVEGGDASVWDVGLLDQVMRRLDALRGAEVVPKAETVIPWEQLREWKGKQLGTKFVKIPKE